MMANWNQMTIRERRVVAEDLAREVLRGFFGDYSGFENMAADKARRQSVDSVLLCLESRTIASKKGGG